MSAYLVQLVELHPHTTELLTNHHKQTLPSGKRLGHVNDMSLFSFSEHVHPFNIHTLPSTPCDFVE